MWKMWKMPIPVSIACVGAGLVLVGGCKRERAERVGTTTLTSADARASVEAAVERIAAGRCERELACDEIRPSRRQTSRETCRDLAKSEIAQELNVETCPRGVDSNKVATCVAVTERADCYDPVGALMRLEDCRASRMCL